MRRSATSLLTGTTRTQVGLEHGQVSDRAPTETSKPMTTAMQTHTRTHDDKLDSLTPSEDLLCELLVARVRAGDPMFTVSAVHRRTLEKAAAKGLVDYKSGWVERTYLAWLTEAGLKKYALDGYQSAWEKEANRQREFAERQNFEGGEARGVVAEAGRLLGVELASYPLEGQVWSPKNMSRVVMAVRNLVGENRGLREKARRLGSM